MMNQVISSVDEKEVVRLTQDLIRIPSVYRPGQADGNEERVAQFVADYLRQMGLQVFYEEVVPGRPNVIAFYDSGRPGKTLLFEAHTMSLPKETAMPGAMIRLGAIFRATASTAGAHVTQKAIWRRPFAP